MVSAELVKERLYKKYIEPTKKRRREYIGIEIEMPIVNLRKGPVDFSVVHDITDKFMAEYDFNVQGRDDEGNIYAAVNATTGDILSYDCSYNNLELSFGKGETLDVLEKRFKSYFAFLKNELNKSGHTLTGMGVNPYRNYNRLEPIPNGRYRMLLHHLRSYKNYNLPMFFHNYPEFGLFSSASQVQLDVDYDDLIVTLNAFSRVEPIKAILFSNSVLLGENESLMCCRDYFWENSTHGINPHNIGMFEADLESIEDLEEYIYSTSIYCVERGDKYINFPPINIIEYFEKDFIEGEYFDGSGYRKINVAPRIDDINYLRTFKFEDLTFRGTIEYRSVCCQPIKDAMTVAAFHLGLNGKVNELYELLKNDTIIYRHGYTAAELRKMFNRAELPSFIDKEGLYGLVLRVLDLAGEGLIARGFGEEKYLAPLYERVARRTNPAKQMLKHLREGGGVENIIKEYGEI